MRPESWTKLERTLAAIAEGQKIEGGPAKQLVDFGLAEKGGDGWQLTNRGEAFYSARLVLHDESKATRVLGDALKEHPIGGGFCEAAWAEGGAIPKEGALRLLKRLLQSGDEVAAKRWLALLSNAGLVERTSSEVTVLWNPGSLGDTSDSPAQAHVISPSTPYQNILSLREVLRDAKDWLWWFEIHMPPKVLEVLHNEIAAGQVSELRLLSGPANITRGAQGDFKLARKEWSAKRGITAEWRVMDRKRVHDHHDRLFLSAAGAYNLPPINTILKGSTSEILPSSLTAEHFETWWDQGTDMLSLQVEPQ